MDQINLKGFPVRLVDDVVEAGVTAEDVTFVTRDLNEVSLYDMDAKVKVLISVPSLDTGVCQAETRRFNQEIGSREGHERVVSFEDLV